MTSTVKRSAIAAVSALALALGVTTTASTPAAAFGWHGGGGGWGWGGGWGAPVAAGLLGGLRSRGHRGVGVSLRVPMAAMAAAICRTSPSTMAGDSSSAIARSASAIELLADAGLTWPHARKPVKFSGLA